MMAYIAVYMLMLEMRLEVNFFDPAAVPFLAQLVLCMVMQLNNRGFMSP